MIINKKLKRINTKNKNNNGMGNEIILENFQKFCDKYPYLTKLVKTPIVPGLNDTEEDVQAIIDYLKGKQNVEYEPLPYETLPYHRLGTSKYEYIGREYPLGEVKLYEEKTDKINKLVENM